MSVTSSVDNASDGSNSEPTLRLIKTGRPLPGGRAIVGGVLVAVAVLAAYAASTRSNNASSTSIVVAAHDIAPGTRLSAADFRTVDARVAPSISSHVVTSTKALSGSVLLGPVRNGDPIAQSLVQAPSAAAPYVQLSFGIPTSRAVDGSLQSGDTVDVIATSKSGTDTQAHVAATRVHVLKVQSAGNGSIGHSGDVTVTVGVDSLTDAAAISAAVDLGQITLVRTTGTNVE